MKMPTLIEGIVRKNRRDLLTRATGILAQQCEEACAEELDPGTDEYAECVAECEEEG